MVNIVTASSFGVDADKFAEEVKLIVKKSTQPIHWQINKGPQFIADLLDTRSGKEIIVNVANKLVECLEKAKESNDDLVIISRQAGSRVIEEALSMVKGLDKLSIEVLHIMLAPEINGSEWKSIGKFAGSALLMGLAGLALTQSRSKKGVAAAMLGLVGTAALAGKNTISERLNEKDSNDENIEEKDKPKFANIKRHIFYNPEDEQFDGLTEVLDDSQFYKGVYPIDDIVSLDQERLNFTFREEKFLRTSEKTKIEILENILK